MTERFNTLARLLAQRCPELELRPGEVMAKHTSFRVGGPVSLMALPKTKAQARVALQTAREMNIVPFFLGNGSNLLVPDEGADRFVIKLVGKYDSKLNQVREVNRQLVAGGGVSLSMLAQAALGRGLTGLEFAAGIPGSVGGAVTMNAGAYGGEMSQVLTQVTAMDLDGNVRDIPVEACGLGYRKSIFTGGDYLILEARFQLQSGDPAAIKARMDELAVQRKSKQPLEFPSAGSTFKRPVGYFAGALIEQAGLKGLTVGGAQVSEKHAGFVINIGGATCSDIMELVSQVRRRVLEKDGVELEMEIRVLK